MNDVNADYYACNKKTWFYFVRTVGSENAKANNMHQNAGHLVLNVN